MNKILVVLILFSSVTAFAEDFYCREMGIRSETTSKSEKIGVCYLKDPSYFISEKCKNLNCAFMEKLKVLKVKPSTEDRPAVIICKAVGGAIEEVKIESSEITKRCLFPKDHTFISFNLLESWDGKKFSGPSDSVEF